jgi:hypothetical protein
VVLVVALRDMQEMVVMVKLLQILLVVQDRAVAVAAVELEYVELIVQVALAVE